MQSTSVTAKLGGVMKPRNLAARVGRWSVHHRKRAIAGWLAFVIVSLAVGGAVGTTTLTGADTQPGEAGRAARAVEDAFPQQASENVLVQGRGGVTATDPQFRAAVGDLVARLERTSGVRDVVSPYAPGAAGQLSADGRSALVTFELPGDADATRALVDAPLAQVAAVARAHPQLRIDQLGDASLDKALMARIGDDFKQAETTSLPLTLLILVIAFGALVAAGVPLLLAITGVMATLGLVGPLSHLSPVDASINQVILLIGLAVGVDYAMFYLRRVREERAAGRDSDAAIEAAAATSGRAVLISGCTVMIAMSGMYLAGDASFVSFATGTIAVVAVAVLGSLTVLPAVLSVLGDRVEKGRIPFLGRLRARLASAGLWSRLVDRVLRRPLLAAALSGGLLVALAVPVLGMHTASLGIESFPRDVPAIAAYDRMQAAFPSESPPVQVVVQARDVDAPAARAAIAELERRALARTELFHAPVTVEASRDGTVARIAIPAAGTGTDAVSNRALDAVRDELVPATVGALQGAEVNVGGFAAVTRDFNTVMQSHIGIVLAFVLSAAFLLLLVTFRSVVVAAKAIVLNLLSVGAAYGLLVLVFQHGWGASLLGVQQADALAAWLPLFLFVVLFGLSMDYHVFILTRIREAFDRGMSTDEAVAHGIKSTAGVVTSAAVVMVAVFAIFATLSLPDLQQMGIGLAAAVLIDATIVRGVLLPATMKLLGERNWWLPRSLGWLPRVAPEEPAGAPVPAAATAGS